MKANALSPFDEARLKAVGEGVGKLQSQQMADDYILMRAAEAGFSQEDTEKLLRAQVGLPRTLDEFRDQASLISEIQELAKLGLTEEDLEARGLGEYKGVLTSAKESIAAEEKQDAAKAAGKTAETERIAPRDAWDHVLGLADKYMNLSAKGQWKTEEVERTGGSTSYAVLGGTTSEQLKPKFEVKWREAVRWAIEKTLATHPYLSEVFADSQFMKNPGPVPSHKITIDMIREEGKGRKGG